MRRIVAALVDRVKRLETDVTGLMGSFLGPKSLCFEMHVASSFRSSTAAANGDGDGQRREEGEAQAAAAGLNRLLCFGVARGRFAVGD